MTRPLFVDTRKWPDAPHWHYTVHPLGEDVHGKWYVRSWDGVVEIIDRDEFELHQIELGYPDDVIRNADREATLLAERVERGREPFGRIGREWLDRAMRQAGAK